MLWIGRRLSQEKANSLPKLKPTRAEGHKRLISRSLAVRNRGHGTSGLCALAPRQAYCEDRTLARFACYGHVATHHARELAGEGKAKPRAAEALSGRSVSLAELHEQLGLLLRRHANAGVGDGELDDGAAIAHLACRKLDLARFGEFAGIAQKVEQDLPQPHRIDGQYAEVLLGVNDEAVLVLLGKLSGGVDDLVDQRR